MSDAVAPGERVFAAPWEAHAFAITVSLAERGVFTWAEWAVALAAEIRRAPENDYYQQWLAALEALVTLKALTTSEELGRYQRAWDNAAHRTPHGAPIALTENDLSAQPGVSPGLHSAAYRSINNS
jgi:nitrile hydratase accessory protein